MLCGVTVFKVFITFYILFSALKADVAFNLGSIYNGFARDPATEYSFEMSRRLSTL